MPTVLFTDIESSTRLWEEHPVAMAEALARHDAILSTAVNHAGGTVVKTTGDGFVAVFDTTENAVASVIAAQIALSGEDWGEVGAVRVRMGVHQGETQTRDGDHYGRDMNRAARVMAAAHGGQVLLSQSAATDANRRLPDGVSLRDLGVHRLKDLTQPEHLFQLAAPGLAGDFSPPLTLNSRPHNLPLQATEFHGRRDELDAIAVLLASPQTRLLTITGPGGAGKTRLGLQVAAEHVNDFADGVFFVDLSSERDPDSAMEAIVRALDLPAGSGDDALGILRSRLRDRTMLLVLDNFEQVTAAGPLVVDLIQQATGLKVVVTSRETLRVRAERVFPIPPLSLPDPKGSLGEILEAESVQLFAERARSIRPGFALDESNAATVAEICLRLDGLPLAIELAAARLAVFTPAELLARLQERLDVLGAGGRDLPDRQRTLWGAIGWSYELLTEPERALFQVLSVFSGCDLLALESVAGSQVPGDVIGLLESLVDKNLIKVDVSGAATRYSMLLMIAEFAAEQLADNPERRDAVREAHARHYSDIAFGLRGRLAGAGRGTALGDLRTDIGNLRTAWRYWVEHGDAEQLLRLIDGLWALHEANGWYQAAIELANDALAVLAESNKTSELATEELNLRTSLARALLVVYGYGDEVERAFREVLALAESFPDARQQYPVLRALANYYINLANFEKGLDLGHRLLELAEQEQDASIGIEAHYIIGATTSFMGDLEGGLVHLDMVIDSYDPSAGSSSRYRLGLNTGVAARTASGLLLWQAGYLDDGAARVADALAFAERIEHPYSRAYAHYHNGFLAVLQARPETAITHATALARLSAENDYVLWGALAMVLEGVADTSLGHVAEGLAKAESGIADYSSLPTPPVFWPLVLGLRATVHLRAGQPERALELIDEAIGYGGPPAFAVHRGDILAALPEPAVEDAIASYIEEARLADETGLRTLGLRALTGAVALRRLHGIVPDGTEMLRPAYAWFDQGEDEVIVIEARRLLEIE